MSNTVKRKKIEFKKIVTYVGELHGVKIFADESVTPGTIELREDENMYSPPYLFDVLKELDVDRWSDFFNAGRIRFMDKRKKAIKEKEFLEKY